MCKKTFETLQDLKSIRDFLRDSSIILSDEKLTDIGLLCFELADNILRHGGSSSISISYDSNVLSIIDSSKKPFNPFKINEDIQRNGGLSFIKYFQEKHPKFKLDYSPYPPKSAFNIITIAIPSDDTSVFEENKPCEISIKSGLLSRYGNEIEEQLRHLGHCPAVIINFKYGSMPYSAFPIVIETTLKSTLSRQQRVIFRMQQNDPTRGFLQTQIDRLNLSYQSKGKIELQ